MKPLIDAGGGFTVSIRHSACILGGRSVAGGDTAGGADHGTRIPEAPEIADALGFNDRRFSNIPGLWLS